MVCLCNGVEFPTTISNLINALRRRSASKSAADTQFGISPWGLTSSVVAMGLLKLRNVT